MRNWLRAQAKAGDRVEQAFTELSLSLKDYYTYGVKDAQQLGGPTRAHRDAKARLTYLVSRMNKAYQPELKVSSSCSATLVELAETAHARAVAKGKANEQRQAAQRRVVPTPGPTLEERIAQLEAARNGG